MKTVLPKLKLGSITLREVLPDDYLDYYEIVREDIEKELIGKLRVGFQIDIEKTDILAPSKFGPKSSNLPL